MNISEIMSHNPRVISADTSVMEAARIMRDENLGAIPVRDNDQLIGMLTDRDITIRITAEGQDPHTIRVRDAMTAKVMYCWENDPIEKALEDMGKLQLHRLPVMDREKNLVGMLSLCDLARAERNHRLLGDTIQQISENR